MKKKAMTAPNDGAAGGARRWYSRALRCLFDDSCCGVASEVTNRLSNIVQRCGCSPTSRLSIVHLPEELLLRIFVHLSRRPRDLLSCANVCQQWRRLAADNSLWLDNGWPLSLASYARFRQRWFCASGRECVLQSFGDKLLSPPISSPFSNLLFCWTRDPRHEHSAVPLLCHMSSTAPYQTKIHPLPTQLSDTDVEFDKRIVLFTDHYFLLSQAPNIEDAERNVTRLAVFPCIGAASASLFHTYHTIEMHHCSSLSLTSNFREHCATHCDSLVVFVQYRGVFAQIWNLANLKNSTQPESALHLPDWLTSNDDWLKFYLGACCLCTEYLMVLNRTNCTILLWPRLVNHMCMRIAIAGGLEPASGVFLLQLPCERQELGRVHFFPSQDGFVYVADRCSRSMFTTYWWRLPSTYRKTTTGETLGVTLNTLHLNDLVSSDESNCEESFVVYREYIIFGCYDGSIRMWDVLADSYKRIIFDAHTAAMKLRCVPEEGFFLSFAQSDGCVKLWDLDSAVLLRCLAFLTLSTPLVSTHVDGLINKTDFDVHVSRFFVTIVHKKNVRGCALPCILSYSFL